MEFLSKIKSYMHKNRVFLCIFAVLCAFSLAAVIFTANDYFLYSDTIARITQIDEREDHREYSNDSQSEVCWEQNISAVILNGERRGESVSMTNMRTESNVYDTRFYEGDEVFISQNADTGAWKTDNVKRDTYIVGMVALCLVTLVAVGRAKGFFAFASVAVNALLFWVGLNIYVSGVNIMVVSAVAAVVFTVVCLVMIGGFTRKTLIAVAATLAGTALTFGIAAAVIYAMDFDGIYVEGLEFLVVEADYRYTFMAELLVGGLGATMDIAMSMSAALCELKRKDGTITRAALLRSGREIGKDITGTMTNVLLFTYMCGTLPLMMVVVRNGVPLINYMINNCSLEITRFLAGSLGIVLTVPIAYVIAALALTRSDRRRKTS